MSQEPKTRSLPPLKDNDSPGPNNKKQRTTTTTTSSTAESQFVTIAPELQPIYLLEWFGNDLPLQPLYGFTVESNQPIPTRPQRNQNQSTTSASNHITKTTLLLQQSLSQNNPNSTSAPQPIQTPFNTPSGAYPNVHVDQIMSVHKRSLPRDILPGQFLIDIVAQNTGRVILACQFANCDGSGNVAPSDIVDRSTQITNPSPNTTTSTQRTTSTTNNSPHITIMGCVAGLFIQFWSRKRDAEFQMRRILNIFSIFVDADIGSRGIGSSLLDGMIYTFEEAVIKREASESASSSSSSSTTTRSKPQWFLTPFDEISLEVRSSNSKAIGFYKGKGFTIENTEPGYYPQGVTPADRKMHEMVVDFNHYCYSPSPLANKLGKFLAEDEEIGKEIGA